METAWWVTLLVAAIPSLVSYLLGRRQAASDNVRVLTEGYGELVQDLRVQVDDMQTEIATLLLNEKASAKESDCLRTQLLRASVRISEVDLELARLREANRLLGIAAEQMRELLIITPGGEK